MCTLFLIIIIITYIGQIINKQQQQQQQQQRQAKEDNCNKFYVRILSKYTVIYLERLVCLIRLSLLLSTQHFKTVDDCFKPFFLRSLDETNDTERIERF